MDQLIMGLSEGKVPKKEKHSRHYYNGNSIARIPGVPPDAVSIQFAAKVIGVHSHTVRRWIKWRYLPAYRSGPQTIRIRRDHLLQVIKALKEAIDDTKHGDWCASCPAIAVKNIKFKP